MSKHRASPFGSGPSKPDPNYQPKHRKHDQHHHWWMLTDDGRHKCVRAGCGALTEMAPKRAWSA